MTDAMNSTDPDPTIEAGEIDDTVTDLIEQMNTYGASTLGELVEMRRREQRHE